MINETFIFTTYNLIDNLDKLGPWSSYGLASMALEHYFPGIEELEGLELIEAECLCLEIMGFEYWDDVIKKYHTEIGYKPENGIFSPKFVNES